MVRTQIQLTEKQSKALKQLARKEEVSMAEVIRCTLDGVVERRRIPDREELKRRALAAIGSVYSDITDMSERRDDYLVEIYSE